MRTGRRPLVRLGVVGAATMVASLATSGCGFPAAQAGAALPGVGAAALPASPPEAAERDAPALAGIQETLDRQTAARAAADRAAFMSTIDQRNLTWRRIQAEFLASLAAGGHRPADTYHVTHVQPKQDGYYKAWIDIAPAGGSMVQRQAVWVFRPTEHGWLHSEILNEEIGPRQTLATEHFTLSYYAWDDDVIGRIAALSEQAYTRVVEALEKAPGFVAQVSVNPTYGAHSGLRGATSLAAYLPDTKTTMLIRSLESFGAGYTLPGETQDDRLLHALTHEYTHLVNDQIVPLVKMKHWMVEGLAEYVSDDMRTATMWQALRSGAYVPLDTASEIIEWKTDPGRGYTPREIDLAYAESAQAVAYFMERYGRVAFFDLARGYAESRQWAETFTQVTGETWEAFQSSWLTWMRRRLNV